MSTGAHRIWRVRILSATWLSYAGFYFCRKNFAIVKSSVQDALQITTSELAHVYTAYLVAYMAGQFLTSLLGPRMATRLPYRPTPPRSGKRDGGSSPQA